MRSRIDFNVDMEADKKLKPNDVAIIMIMKGIVPAVFWFSMVALYPLLWVIGWVLLKFTSISLTEVEKKS